MSRVVHHLACVWMFLAYVPAALSLVVCVDLVYPRLAAYSDPVNMEIMQALLGLALVAWTLPLALASRAVLQDKRWGSWLLACHTGLASVVWFALVSILGPGDMKRFETDGRYYGSMVPTTLYYVAIATLSAFTAIVMVRNLANGTAAASAGRPEPRRKLPRGRG